MKDKLYIGLLAGLIAPFFVIALLYLVRFHDRSVSTFIEQAFLLKVHLKLISIGVFFSNLGLFYLFMRFNKNNASKGVIMSVILYFFFMLVCYYI